MKKIISIAAAMLLTVSAFAQEGRAIYNKYSDQKGVEAVYVSPTMFRLIGRLPELEIADADVDISPIISSLSGFYMLETENRTVAANLREDMKKYIRNGKFELVMEVKENDDDKETVSIYTVTQGDKITNLTMTAVSRDETVFICIDGTIRQDDFDKLMGAAMKRSKQF